MINGIIGKKIGMTSIFDSEGMCIPVTVIEAGPCPVMQVKTLEKDKYKAVQLGFEDKKPQRVKKPETGHAKKAKVLPKKVLREIRLYDEDTEEYKLGQEIRVEQIFAAGDKVDVQGTSIGKGYAGVMKRHNFRGFKATHGTHEVFRHGGSIGMAAWPAKVLKGVKMPGQLGNAKVTIQNIEVVEVKPEQNLILIKGAIPGHRNNFVLISKAVKISGSRTKGQAA